MDDEGGAARLWPGVVRDRAGAGGSGYRAGAGVVRDRECAGGGGNRAGAGEVMDWAGAGGGGNRAGAGEVLDWAGAGGVGNRAGAGEVMDWAGAGGSGYRAGAGAGGGGNRAGAGMGTNRAGAGVVRDQAGAGVVRGRAGACGGEGGRWHLWLLMMAARQRRRCPSRHPLPNNRTLQQRLDKCLGAHPHWPAPIPVAASNHGGAYARTTSVSGMSFPSAPSRPTASGMRHGSLTVWPGDGGLLCFAFSVSVWLAVGARGRCRRVQVCRRAGGGGQSIRSEGRRPGSRPDRSCCNRLVLRVGVRLSAHRLACCPVCIRARATGRHGCVYTGMCWAYTHACMHARARVQVCGAGWTRGVRRSDTHKPMVTIVHRTQ
eukprot:365743-Chlamydomonas_euryale.AAC.40